MKKHFLTSLFIWLFLGPFLLAQPHRWSAELMAARGFGNSPTWVFNVQGNYYFMSSDLFRAGAGAGVSMSKPMSAVLESGEKRFGYTEWSLPVYLRGEYLKPSQTNGNLVLRMDAGYRIGVHTAYYSGLKAVTKDAGIRYWSGLFLEPQVVLIVPYH